MLTIENRLKSCLVAACMFASSSLAWAGPEGSLSDQVEQFWLAVAYGRSQDAVKILNEPGVRATVAANPLPAHVFSKFTDILTFFSLLNEDSNPSKPEEDLAAETLSEMRVTPTISAPPYAARKTKEVAPKKGGGRARRNLRAKDEDREDGFSGLVNQARDLEKQFKLPRKPYSDILDQLKGLAETQVPRVLSIYVDLVLNTSSSSSVAERNEALERHRAEAERLLYITADATRDHDMMSKFIGLAIHSQIHSIEGSRDIALQWNEYLKDSKNLTRVEHPTTERRAKRVATERQ